MSNLWKTATSWDPMQYAKKWADEYPLSPVAHPEVVHLIRQFPPTPDHHEMYSKVMNNVAHYHGQEWHLRGIDDEFHEPAYHLTNNLLEAHNGYSPMEDLL
jgi:hypothetical protein